jgi:hypothetical protein
VVNTFGETGESLMSKLSRSFLALSLLTSVAAFVQAQPKVGFADPVLGRWDATVTGADGVSYPSWFEVRLRKETELMGGFVGRFGSLRHASKVDFSDGQLTITVPVQYEQNKKDLVFVGKLAGDRLEGTTEDEHGKTIKWTAVRAPAMVRGGAPAWGKPIQLFNGKDLTGWRLRDRRGGDCWKVEGGVLVNNTPCADLVSEQKFADFKLRAEFKVVPQGNSGVYLRGRHEVQIADQKFYGPALDSLRMGGVYGFIKPVVDAAKAPGEWQTYEITLLGRKVTIVLNGQTIVDNETIPGITGGALDSDEGAPGPLMLQGDHTKVYFRKIEVTPAK